MPLSTRTSTLHYLLILPYKAFKSGVHLGRHGLGAIYIWPAGNERSKDRDGNLNGYVSSRYTITVGSVGMTSPAFYSEPCACLLISAPSSSDDGGFIPTVAGKRVE